MAIGDRIRIVTEKEYRIMSPPRKPRGEKPATTIRYLKRQIANLQTACASHRNAAEDRAKVIAGYDVQLSEADDTERVLRRRVADQAGHISELAAKLRLKSERLAFLEGYYAKSQEIGPPRPVYATLASIAGDPAQTETRRRSGDQEGLQAGRSGGQSAWPSPRSMGAGEGSGAEIRSQRPNDHPHPDGRPMEHAEIKDNRYDMERKLWRPISPREDWSA